MSLTGPGDSDVGALKDIDRPLSGLNTLRTGPGVGVKRWLPD